MPATHSDLGFLSPGLEISLPLRFEAMISCADGVHSFEQHAELAGLWSEMSFTQSMLLYWVYFARTCCRLQVFVVVVQVYSA